MLTVELTSQDALDLLSAITCKIALTKRYIETLDRLTRNGVDCTEDKAKEEATIRKMESLIEKIGF